MSEPNVVIQTPGHALSNHAFGQVDLDAEFSFGHVIGVRPPRDRHPPRGGPGSGDRSSNTGTLFEEAYLSAQWQCRRALLRHFSTTNWEPSVVQGVLPVAFNAYSIEHFAATIGSPGFQLQTWVAGAGPEARLDRYLGEPGT